MLWVNLTTIEGIKDNLQERYLRIRNKGEIIYELIGTKQEMNETSMEFSEKTSISGSKGIVNNHWLNGECVRKVGYIEESKIECLIDTSSQVSIIPFSFLNKIVNIKMGKPSPWLRIRVPNGENVKHSDEENIMAVMKWPIPDTVKELRSCMGFVVYTLVYYSKLIIDFNTI